MSTRIRKSLLVRVAISARSLARISRLTVCDRTSTTDPISEPERRSLGVQTAMTTSAPMSRATLIGMLAASPPSTSSLPSIPTAGNTPGREIEARIAIGSSPEPSTTASPVAMSVATALKGIARSSKSSMRVRTGVKRRSSFISIWSETAPVGSRIPAAETPSPAVPGKSACCCFWRKVSLSRSGSGEKTPAQLTSSTAASSCAPLRPEA